MEVAAVLVTRGDVDVAEVLASEPFRGETAVWNNAVEADLAVYGRYAAIDRVTAPVIFVQDDDCVLPPESYRALLDAYRPGTVASVMSAYHQTHHRDDALIGFGALFDRGLPAAAFRRYSPLDPVFLATDPTADPAFRRCCDVVFTALTPRVAIDVPFRYLPWSSTSTRMWKQPGFAIERETVLDRVLAA